MSTLLLTLSLPIEWERMFHDHSFFKYFPVDNWESPGGPPSIGYRHDRYREVDVLARRLTKHQEKCFPAFPDGYEVAVSWI